MANELLTAGIKILYAVETTAGTRPTTGFTQIANVKKIGSVNPEPATQEVTDLSDTVWKRYILGLKDPGGAISLTVNITEAFKTAWATLCTAYTTAKASNKATWFEVQIPGFTDSFYFGGEPSELGLPEIDTDKVLDGDVFIVPNQIVGWAAKST